MRMLDGLTEIKGPLARHPALGLAGGAVTAAAGFAALNAATVQRGTAGADRAIGKRAKAGRGHPARRAAKTLAPIGKWYTYLPLATLLAVYLLAAPEAPLRDRGRRRGPRVRSRRLAGAGAIMLAGLIATGLNPVFDRVLPQPPRPPGRRRTRKSVFPSGHAFGPGAIALAGAWVLSREGLARPAVAFPLALATPAITAGGRLLEEKHWASDVVGGYLGAIALAAGCLSAYEATR